MHTGEFVQSKLKNGVENCLLFTKTEIFEKKRLTVAFVYTTT